MSKLKKIVFVTPWPNQVTGVGEYAWDLIGELSKDNELDITVVTSCKNPEQANNIHIISCPDNKNLPDLSSFDLIIHQIGNNPFHTINYLLLKQYGGIVQLHDLVLHDFVRQLCYEFGGEEYFYKTLKHWYGEKAVDIEKNFRAANSGLYASSLVIEFPLFEEILQYADAVIVHSDFAKRKIEIVFDHLPIYKSQPLYNVSPDDSHIDCPLKSFNIGSFGIDNKQEHNDKLLAAHAKIVNFCSESSITPPILTITGQGTFSKLRKTASSLGISNYVNIVSSHSSTEFSQLIKQMNLVLQLYYPTRGEESNAPATKALQLGIPVIVPSVGWYSELPNFIPKTKCPPDVNDIYQTIINTLFSKDLNTENNYLKLAKTTLEYVSKEMNYSLYLNQYKNLLLSFNSNKSSTNMNSHTTLSSSNLVSPTKIFANNPSIKVLVDLSMALKGYSGIPQDARLLLKTLSTLNNTQASGLIFKDSSIALRTDLKNFENKNVTQKILICSELISAIINPDHPKYSQFKLKARLQKIKDYLKLKRHKSFNIAKIDNNVFYNLIWRNLLSQTFSDEDYNTFLKSDFYISNINLHSVNYHLSKQRSVKLNTKNFDFIIFQDQRTVTPSPQTKKIIRYHDAIPVIDIDTTVAGHGLVHANSLQLCMKDSFYVCNSEPTREDLIKIAPQLEKRSITIPYTLPTSYSKNLNYAALKQIFQRRTVAGIFNGHIGFDYILTICTLEPRKNYLGLIRAFEKLQAEKNFRLKLVIVGNPGWKSENILAAMQPLLRDGSMLHLQNLTPEELPYLYSHASAFVFPSYNEGFGFPPMEAMQCECPAIVSDIKAHRWVMGDSAMYCNPYDIDSIANAIYEMTISPQSPMLRSHYIQRGLERVKLYSLEKTQEQWLNLFDKLKSTDKIN